MGGDVGMRKRKGEGCTYWERLRGAKSCREPGVRQADQAVIGAGDAA